MSKQIEVIGVRFKEVGKVYYFDPNGEKYAIGDRAIVETSRGIECGEVAVDHHLPTTHIVYERLYALRCADYVGCRCHLTNFEPFGPTCGRQA